MVCTKVVEESAHLFRLLWFVFDHIYFDGIGEFINLREKEIIQHTFGVAKRCYM